MRGRTIRQLFVFVLLASAFPGCGAAPVQTGEWSPHAQIKGLNLSGRWYSQDFGDMEMTQTDKKVAGKYDHPRGPEHNGTIRGEITGDILHFEWIQPGDTTAAVFPIKGHGVFRISADGKQLEGRWGYDDDDVGGGAWRADKSSSD